MLSYATYEQRRRAAGLLLLAPAIVALLAILGYPVLESLVLAFQKVQLAAGGIDRQFVGLANFERLAADATFQKSLVNTLYFAAFEVVLVTMIAFAVALLLNHPIGRSGLFRILLVVPWAIAPVANAVLWKWILNANYGVLNGILQSLGIIDTYRVWLGTPSSALNFLLLVDVWKSVPFVALLLLAGLQRVPSTLYKAAYMDGANRVQTFIHVTLPSMRAAIAVAVVLQTIWSLRIFDLVFVLTRGGPADATVLMNFLAYRVTFNFLDIGYGAAIANVIFVMTVLLAILYIRLVRPAQRVAR